MVRLAVVDTIFIAKRNSMALKIIIDLMSQAEKISQFFHDRIKNHCMFRQQK